MVHDVITSPILDLFESLQFNAETVDGKRVIKKFSTENEEINSLYKGVGLRDISFKGIIELRGKDVLDFLHRITTNSIKDLPKEKLVHTIFTNEKGKIIDIGTLLNFDDYQLLICNTEYKYKVKSWIDKYTITDDVKAINVNGKYVVLELIGPQTESFLMMLCGNIPGNIQNDSFKVINAEGMLFFLAKLAVKNGTQKYWIIADPENGKKLVTFMNDNKGPYDFNLIGEDAYNVFRVKHGIPAAPNELNDTVNPHEVKLLDYIDFKKGCYIGQEVIARLETYDKVQRFIMGVKFINEVHVESSLTLFNEDNSEAGKVTSIVYSDKCKKYIGLAFVRRPYAEEGKELIAKSEDGSSYKIIVCDLPFKK